jgi:hypothetical protein
MATKECSNLAQLKTQYEKLRQKYKLPPFSQLNEEFEIEKVQERETEILLREIRHVMTEKMAAFLHFLELFINPTMAPMFILNAMKNLGESDKKLIEEIYGNLVTLEFSSLTLDISYDEKKEADFIKNIAKKWQNLRPELQQFAELLSRIQPKKEKSKGYVG